MSDYSLREKKYAKTKLRLTAEFMSRLDSISFDDVNIKEICEVVEISEATFFNYFPKKVDILYYHKALMNLRLQWLLDARGVQDDPLMAIVAVFEIFADNLSSRKQVHEIITVYLREGCEGRSFPEVTAVEKHFCFPGYKGIEGYDNRHLDDIFRHWLEVASEKNVLPKGVDVEDLIISLFSIFIGTIVALDSLRFKDIKKYYRQQLDILWKGIGGK